jgi:hypothetical protein
MRRAVLLTASCWLLAGMSALAQTSGGISGFVLDESRSSVPAALVEVENRATGLRRSATTALDGYYSVPGLPIGTYHIEVSKERFQTVVRRETAVAIGESVRLDFILAPRVLTERIEVQGSTRADTSGIGMDRSALAKLPINGRDYVQFTQFAPGALTRTGQLADLTFNGLHSVHNQFSIDGVDATRGDMPYVANGAERGARLLTGSLDSISEFRVEKANYAPEFGRAAAAWINIATRSGTNQWHGALFTYLRNEALDARNFFNARSAPRAHFRYLAPGANVAGPIRRNSTFFFVNYEGSRQQIGVLGSGTVPSDSLRNAILQTSPALAPVVAAMPAGTAPTSDPRVDRYTTTAINSIREDTGSVKIDRRFQQSNSASVRININDSRVRGPLYAIQAAALGSSDLQDVPVRAENIALSDQHIFTPRLLNDVVAGMQRVTTRLITDLAPPPMVAVTGLTILPGSRGRSLSANTSYQAEDHVTFVTGDHTVKWGAAGRTTRLVQTTSDVSLLVYTSLDDFTANRAAQASLAGGNPGSATWGYEWAFWAQDGWRLHPRLTINYGLRYDRFDPPFDPQGRTRPFDRRIGALAFPGSPYFAANRGDVAPRVGLAWQAWSRLTFRAGGGIYFAAYPAGYAAAIAANTLAGTTTLRIQQIPNLSYPLTQFRGLGTAALPAVSGFEWRKPDVSAQQWTLAAEYEFPTGDVFRMGYAGNHGVHLRRNLNINLIDPSSGRSPNPAFSSINLETADGNSSYHALELGWTRRFRSRLSGTLQYAWSHAIDDVPDPAVSSSAQPQDGRNLRAERGNGSSDARHRLSWQWLWNLPLDHGRWQGGWSLASVARLRTGIPETVLIGTNTYGDGNLVNQRPNAVAGVDPYGPNRSTSWFNPAAFAMPVPGTFGNLGRNTVYGPGLVQVDVSINKEIRVHEKCGAQVRVEAFNILNHPNFGQPNAIFGTAAFGRTLATVGKTIGPGTARQIQVAIRLSFD